MGRTQHHVINALTSRVCGKWLQLLAATGHVGIWSSGWCGSYFYNNITVYECILNAQWNLFSWWVWWRYPGLTQGVRVLSRHSLLLFICVQRFSSYTELVRAIRTNSKNLKIMIHCIKSWVSHAFCKFARLSVSSITCAHPLCTRRTNPHTEQHTIQCVPIQFNSIKETPFRPNIYRCVCQYHLYARCGYILPIFWIGG